MSKESKNTKRLEFGVGEPIRENHARDHTCIDWKCKMSKICFVFEYQLMIQNCIGVKKAPFANLSSGDDYALLIECPECKKDFWFHINEDLLEYLYNEIKSGRYKVRSDVFDVDKI